MYKRKLYFSLLLVLIYLGGFFLLYKSRGQTEKSLFSTTIVEKRSNGPRTQNGCVNKTEAIGSLTIPKMNLIQPLYPIESPKNNVDENVTILKESTYPNTPHSTFFLAAHSGTGKVAYFEQLDVLKIGDTFSITYQENTYTYQIKEIEIQEKTGKISVPVYQEKQAILTTCHPKKENKQLVLYATLKKETGSNT